MSDPLEDLQVNVAHQELAVEALSDEVAGQGRLIAELRAELDQLKRQMRELKPSPLDQDTGDEPPPPHY
jgi:uncharacterized coiled-coil protein SlyX